MLSTPCSLTSFGINKLTKMAMIFGLILTISAATLFVCAVPVPDTTLELTFMIHRHGDRTPIGDNIQLVTDQEKVQYFIEKYGYGQLTDTGRLKSYRLGKFIRERYNELLSPQYNKSEIFIRSTDSTRTKMTVLSAMAAVYRVGNDNDDSCADIHWTPVPYTTVPPLYDFNLAFSNCPTLQNASNASLHSSSSRMLKYNQLLEKWSQYTNVNLTQQPVQAYSVQDVYKSQISLGIPVYPELEELMPEIDEAAGEAIDIVYGGDNARLNAGVLLNEFFIAVDKLLSGESPTRVHVYSAHDVNVYSFFSLTKGRPLQGVPPYAALYALELRRVIATGQYVVVPIFVKSPGADVLTLNVEGCGDVCSLDEYRVLMADSVMEVKEWREECGFTDDLVIDTFSID